MKPVDDLLQALKARFPAAEMFTFGDSAELNADIIEMVRTGRKTISCDALKGFQDRGEAFPKAGRVDIALDWNGVPQLLVRTEQVDFMRFDEMSEDLIAAQGEFEDLEDWRRSYEAYLSRSVGFSEDMEMLVERFSVFEDLGK